MKPHPNCTGESKCPVLAKSKGKQRVLRRSDADSSDDEEEDEEDSSDDEEQAAKYAVAVRFNGIFYEYDQDRDSETDEDRDRKERVPGYSVRLEGLRPTAGLYLEQVLVDPALEDAVARLATRL